MNPTQKIQSEAFMIYDVPHYDMLFVAYGIFTHVGRKQRENSN